MMVNWFGFATMATHFRGFKGKGQSRHRADSTRPRRAFGITERLLDTLDRRWQPAS